MDLNLQNKSAIYFCLLFTYIFVVVVSHKSVVANDSNQTNAGPARKPSGRYCGLYCLYATMKLYDREIEFSQLIKPEYISSFQGSSLAELKKAAEDNGLYATPATKLTIRVLRQCHYPVILHIKPYITSKTYDHYELFLRTKNGKAKLFDPPEQVRLVPFRELVPRWDGNGLIISAGPIDLGTIFAPARKRFILYVVLAIAVILMVHWGSRQWLASADKITLRRLLGLSMTQCTGFAIAALLCGMIYHFANDEGLLANSDATATIQQAYLGNFIPKVSEKKVHKLLDTNTVFIDARLARDFKVGHLEGAINIPVNADDDGRQKIIANIDKDARIVVYCQSASCKFAEKVAVKLMADGFNNISIFNGGWRKWVAKKDKLREKPS